MQQHKNTYTELFVSDTPLMDVRAPIEYQRGAFPNAKNLPIMDNYERELVGICFKHHGQQQAIKKGDELVHGELRKARISKWIEFANQNPSGSLYCFRGGLRSQIAQQWLHESGIDFPLIQGGYKALRSFMIDALDSVTERHSFQLVGGKTGCGKTTLIKNLPNGIDLEAAAYHRGSSFGRHVRQQNNQINFENHLAIDFIKLRYKGIKNTVLEDEARTIGKVGIPKNLFEQMRESPLVVIEEPYEARLERLIQEYVVEMHAEFIKLNGEIDGFKSFSTYLLSSLERIQKRLGPARFGGIYKNMEHALAKQSKTGDISKHYDWLTAVLNNYYDPMYEDQLKQRQKHIIFRGNHYECIEYLQQ